MMSLNGKIEDCIRRFRRVERRVLKPVDRSVYDFAFGEATYDSESIFNPMELRKISGQSYDARGINGANTWDFFDSPNRLVKGHAEGTKYFYLAKRKKGEEDWNLKYVVRLVNRNNGLSSRGLLPLDLNLRSLIDLKEDYRGYLEDLEQEITHLPEGIGEDERKRALEMLDKHSIGGDVVELSKFGRNGNGEDSGVKHDPNLTQALFCMAHYFYDSGIAFEVQTNNTAHQRAYLKCLGLPYLPFIGNPLDSKAQKKLGEGYYRDCRDREAVTLCCERDVLKPVFEDVLLKSGVILDYLSDSSFYKGSRHYREDSLV